LADEAGFERGVVIGEEEEVILKEQVSERLRWE
jgi:hypothetical protein